VSLTPAVNMRYSDPALTQVGAGIDTLVTSAKALFRSAFFMPKLYGGLYGGSSERRSRTGSINPVQSATFIQIDTCLWRFSHKYEGSTMNDLVIHDKSVRTLNNLYCLNDLHKASGGVAKHQPSNFLRNNQVKDLIAEITNSSDLRNIQSIAGRHGGTYVCEELVYAYAMWVNAEFALHVIRVFKAQQYPALSTLPPEVTEYIDNTATVIAMQARTKIAAKITAWAHERPHLSPQELIAWMDGIRKPRPLFLTSEDTETVRALMKTLTQFSAELAAKLEEVAL